MKVVISTYDGVFEFEDVAGYAPTELYLTIMYTVDGLTVETSFPTREITRFDVHHTINVVEEAAKEAASEAARKQLSLPGM